MINLLSSLIKVTDIKSDYGIELINKVDTFYNSAWDKLVLIGTISFAVIGLLVPFVIQWYQKKSLKVSEELLKKEMENQSMKLKAEILEDINNTLEERIKDFENKINELNASITAKTFHLQGNGHLADKLYAEALSDYITAAQNYLISHEHHNLQTVMRLIYESCIPNLSGEEINDIKITHDCDLEILLSDLSANDEKGSFTKLIRDIRFSTSKLPKTINDKK